MINPAMVIRVAANIDELRRNMADGQNVVNTTAASMQRMMNSLSGDKLIRSAQSMTAAITQMGGATKLTAAEADRAATLLGKAIEKSERMGKTVPDAMRQTHAELKKVAASANDAGGAFDFISTKAVAIGSAIGTFLGQLAYDAVRKLGSALIEIGKRGIQLAPVKDSFDSLARSIGQSGDEMVRVTRTATKGLIADLDIMAASNKAMLLGLPVTAESMGDLAQSAVVLGKAMKQDAQKSLDDFITALGRSSPMILDNLGLSVKVGEANEAYAKSLGKTAAALTDGEKKLAFYNAAVDAAKRKVEELGGLQLTLADRVTQAQVVLTNFTDGLGIAIAKSPVLNTMLASLAEQLQKTFGESQDAQIRTLIGRVNDLAIMLATFGQAGLFVAAGIARAWSALELVINSVGVTISSSVAFVSKGIAALQAGAAALRPFDVQQRLIAKQWEEIAVQAEGYRQAYVEMTKEAFEGVKGNSALAKTIGELDGALGKMKAEMIAAKDIAPQLSGALAGSSGGGGVAGAANEASDAVKKLTERLTGAALQKEANELAQALKAAGGAAALSAPQYQFLVQQVMKLREEGARLPPELDRIARSMTVLFREVNANNPFVDANGRSFFERAGQGVGLFAVQFDQAKAVVRSFFDSIPKATELGPVIFKPFGEGGYIFNLEAIAVNTQQVTAENSSWEKSLDMVGGAFDRLANVAGDTMSAIVRAIGTAINAAGAFAQSLKQIKQPGAANKIAGAAGAFGAGMSVDELIAQGEGGTRGAIGGAAAGAMTGAAIGSVIPGLGTLAGMGIGAAVGGIAGAIRGSRRAKELNNIRDEFMALQGGLAGVHRTIANMADDPQLRRAFNLLYFADSKEKFEAGAAAYEQRLEELQAQLQRNLTSSGVLWDKFTQKIIASGQAVEGLKEAFDQQLGDMATATNALTGRVGTQEEFDRLSRLVMSTVTSHLQQGKSGREAIEAVGPAIDQLAGFMDTLGMKSNAALAELLKFSNFVEVNTKLLDQTAALNQLLVAQANIGTLSAETWVDIQEQGVGTYHRIMAAALDAGYSQAEAQRIALDQIAPLLNSIIQLHKERGLAIDDETQALIDAAREEGVLREQQLSTNDILMEGLGAIIRLLGGELPEAWRNMADEARQAAEDVQDALDDIEPPSFHVGIGGPPGAHDTPDLPGFAGGTGGRFLDFGVGTPVVLHGRERVMTEAEGRGSAPVQKVYTGDAVFMLDGEVVSRVSLERLLRKLETNDGGGDPNSPVGRMQDALGIA